MRVLLVMPLALPAYLFQLASISAFLKSKAHTVRYEELVISGDFTEEHRGRLNRAIKEFKPDIIGLSSYEMSFEWIKLITDHLKKNSPNVPIIVGGYHATLSPEEVLTHPPIDIICIGEGEYPLYELLESIKRGEVVKNIPNLWFKDGPKVIRNPLRPLMANLDELPFVDRELFTSENRKNGILEIMASRGCPFDCTNCANHALKKIYAGKGPYLRYRSPDNVLKEIEHCLSKEHFKLIQFDDDMFTSNQNWLRDFCAKYKTRINLPFICNIRPEAGVSETLGILKEAGCVQVSIGVEAGDEKIRRSVLHRDMPDKLIIQAFRNARKAGIKTKSFNMVGLPHETTLDLWKTIWLNLKLAPDSVQTSVYYPFKGTVLGDECYGNGWVDLERKKKLRLYANDSILNLPTVSRPMIRAAKWINSATVLRSGNFSVIKIGFLMIIRRFLPKRKQCQPACQI